MKYGVEELNAGLQELTGRDFAEAEKAERAAGNYSPTLQFSSEFLARLGAMAIKANPHEIKNLPLNQYYKFTNAVSNFLFSGLEESTTDDTAK